MQFALSTLVSLLSLLFWHFLLCGCPQNKNCTCPVEVKMAAWIGGARDIPLQPSLYYPGRVRHPSRPLSPTSPFCEPSGVFPGCPPTLSLPCVHTPRPFGPLALWSGPLTYARCGSASPFALCRPYRRTSGSEPSGGTQEGTPLTTGCLAVGPVLARQLVACVSLSFLLSVTPTVRRA